MQQLNEAIAAVLREVQRGSAAAQEASRLALLPERVRLTLNFSLDAGRPPCAQAEGPHSVTLEFIVGTAGDWKSMPLPDGDISSVPSVTEENKLVPALARVFGEPGFDSSARATVFRETLEGMSDAQAQEVLAALTSPLADIPEEPTCRAVHILRGVILSGPTKQIERGALVLRSAISGRALGEVLREVAATWKTQDDWLD